jgi:Skp family chaperone for outer membrane proteins
MKATDLLEKIKTLLSAKVNLAEMTLENGTILEAESFATGESVFIKSDDERVALPIGEYTLEDGRMLIVEEEGIIAEIKQETAMMPAEELAEVEVEVEPESYDTPKAAEQIEEVLQAVVEAIAPEIEKIQQEVAEMKKELEEVKMQYKKKEEMAAQTPAAKPKKHSPEATKTAPTKLATRRSATTMDIVMQKLNNR